MKTKLTTALVALALTFTLTACGNSDPAPVETTIPNPVPTVTTPAPTETPSEEYEGEVVERDENGVITLPDGSVADCPEDSNGAFVKEDGSWSCDTGVDW